MNYEAAGLLLNALVKLGIPVRAIAFGWPKNDPLGLTVEVRLLSVQSQSPRSIKLTLYNNRIPIDDLASEIESVWKNQVQDNARMDAAQLTGIYL